MTDLDERLRVAGEAFREQPVPDLALRWPEDKREHRWLAPIAVAAAVALVVAGVAIVRSTMNSTPPVKPAPVLVPGSRFAVVGPPSYAHGGGMVLAPVPPACAVSSLRTSAATKQAADGVVGLISITGSNCLVSTQPYSLHLVDRKGKRLPIPVANGNEINPGINRGQAINEAGGAVRVGFAWTGSYCGSARVAVQLKVNERTVRVPLAGPTPSCQKSTEGALIPGSVGGPDQAVMPAPNAWKALSVRVVLPKTLPWHRAFALTVVLTNNSKSDVSLASPCPTWNVNLDVDHLGWGAGSGLSGNLCSKALVVEPGVPLTLHLGTLPLGTSGAEVRGAIVRVDWSITGVPTATAKAVIR